jgi:hypothetical protein
MFMGLPTANPQMEEGRNADHDQDFPADCALR